MARYHFGGFRLLEEEKQLFGGEKQIPLTNRRFALLLILVQRAGEIVTKEEMIAEVWGGVTVEESNISQQIYQLRLLLGDDARHQNFIETLPSIGYRFKAKVEREETEVVEEVNEAVSATGASLPARGEGPSKRRRHLALALGMMAAILVWIGTIVAREGGLTGKDRNLPRDPLVRPLVSLPGMKTHPAFSRDGKWISFSLKDGVSNNFDIYLIEADQPWTRVPRRLTSHPLGESHSAWSPDGRQIAFLRLPELAEERFRLMILDIETKKEWEVGRVWGGLDWSPDGQFFAVSDNLTNGTSSGIFLLSTDGRERRPLSTPPPTKNLYDFNPRFSPDGTKLIFTRAYSDLFREIFLVDLRSGALTQLTYDQRAIVGTVWTPDGQEILFLSNRSGFYRLWRMPAKGGEAQLVEKVSIGDFGQMGTNSLAISPIDEQIVLGTESEDAQILVRSLPGTIRERERPCWIQSS
ncbi:MAG: winged helix-turn-helix domain-containing protein, partial [Blastocatellia bacterium]